MDEVPPNRLVTLVLVDRDAVVLGQLAPFVAATPWWMDVDAVVRGAREVLGATVTVLRLLDSARPSPHGGQVTYLAEVDDAETVASWLAPCEIELVDDPKRLDYAKVGGPRADLAWATSALGARGIAVVGAPEQRRTWNLSSIWSIPTSAGTAWLKVVPPFFAHEGPVVTYLRDAAPSARLPMVLATEGPRTLLADLPGIDCYEATLAERLGLIDQLVALQSALVGRVGELVALGLPDWRFPALTRSIGELVDRRAGELDVADRGLLARFVVELPARCQAIDDCGLAASLVHGDFHPGNVRSDGTTMTIIDWGDCGVGHPLLDLPAFVPANYREAPNRDAPVIVDHWAAMWRAACPGSNPRRAAQLLAPIASARQALIYQTFLDHIEASEHRYHCADVPAWLQRTATSLRDQPSR